MKAAFMQSFLKFYFNSHSTQHDFQTSTNTISTRPSQETENNYTERISLPQFHKTSLQRSALFNIRRKALGHLMKFTQRSIPYRFWINRLSTAFYRLGLGTAFTN